MMSNDWFYLQASKPCGPVSADELRFLLLQGTVTRKTYVRRGELGPWSPAGKWGELDGRLQQPDRLQDAAAETDAQSRREPPHVVFENPLRTEPEREPASTLLNSATVERRKPTTSQIFLSYRRNDSADATGRIYDRLTTEFGKPRIFKDVDSIPIGVSFVDRIVESIAQSEVVLVIIGRNWINTTDPSGMRRLDMPQDVVRREIEAAFQHGVRIIPVLVQDALMPTDAELPASIRGLAKLNAAKVRPGREFEEDMNQLCRAIHAPSWFRRHSGLLSLAGVVACILMIPITAALWNLREPAVNEEPIVPVETVEIPVVTSSAGKPLRESEVQKRIRQFLKEKTEMSFIDVPLRDVADNISDAHAIPVAIDTNSLLDEGLSEDELINLEVTDTLGDAALSRLLSPLYLTYTIEDDTLLITTQSIAEARMTPLIYDVRDFVAKGQTTDQLRKTLEAAFLVKWEDRDGFGGIFDDSIPGSLLIRQTWPVHLKIENLFKTLRESDR